MIKIFAVRSTVGISVHVNPRPSDLCSLALTPASHHASKEAGAGEITRFFPVMSCDRETVRVFAPPSQDATGIGAVKATDFSAAPIDSGVCV
jgi:hypothetical protein